VRPSNACVTRIRRAAKPRVDLGGNFGERHPLHEEFLQRVVVFGRPFSGEGHAASLALMKPPHDLREDDAEGFCRRLGITGKPTAARTRVSSSEERKVGFRLRWPRKAREIAEADAGAVNPTDIPVRFLRCFLRNIFAGLGSLPILSVNSRGSSSGTSVHNTHDNALTRYKLDDFS